MSDTNAIAETGGESGASTPAHEGRKGVEGSAPRPPGSSASGGTAALPLRSLGELFQDLTDAQTALIKGMDARGMHDEAVAAALVVSLEGAKQIVEWTRKNT